MERIVVSNLLVLTLVATVYSLEPTKEKTFDNTHQLFRSHSRSVIQN